jgi:endogenous inhibitor of DNA gyrase (YacG/DUF329 family)
VIQLCSDCDALMTDEEIEFYVFRCDRCEKLDLFRHERWRKGGEDEELDLRYSQTVPGVTPQSNR